MHFCIRRSTMAWQEAISIPLYTTHHLSVWVQRLTHTHPPARHRTRQLLTPTHLPAHPPSPQPLMVQTQALLWGISLVALQRSHPLTAFLYTTRTLFSRLPRTAGRTSMQTCSRTMRGCMPALHQSNSGGKVWRARCSCLSSGCVCRRVESSRVSTACGLA